MTSPANLSFRHSGRDQCSWWVSFSLSFVVLPCCALVVTTLHVERVWSARSWSELRPSQLRLLFPPNLGILHGKRLQFIGTGRWSAQTAGKLVQTLLITLLPQPSSSSRSPSFLPGGVFSHPLGIMVPHAWGHLAG